MIKIKYSVLAMVLSMMLSCEKSVKKEPMENSHQFFKKLSKNGGMWVHFPRDTTTAFHSFIMKFALQEGDTLTGSILGYTKTADTIPFWHVKEYINVEKDSIIFTQQGQYGRANGTSYFPNSITRESNFKMVYANGVDENHKDTHIFINDSTMLTKSKIFDNQTQEWIEQPNAIWTFKHTIKDERS